MTVERINWVTGKPLEAIQAYTLWRTAVEQADNGDSGPLIALFRSEMTLGPEARLLIADLLDRRPLHRKRGGQAIPAYRISLAEARLADLGALVRYYRKKGQGLDDAIRSTLREKKREDADPDGIYSDAQIDEMITSREEESLRAYVCGRRGASQRRKQRIG